ncbi:hypothetical protein MTO96_048288 [Rhipicephalus appendiculatus]
MPSTSRVCGTFLSNREEHRRNHSLTREQKESKSTQCTPSSQQGYAEDDETNVDVLDLPYAGLDYSLTILLPRVRTGVDALRQNLTWPVFQRLLSKLNVNSPVEVSLPKFKIEGSYKLKAPLSALGASKAFDERHADFSGISGARDLIIYDVVHKAVVEVNEEGSEAAGATAVIFYTKSAAVGIPFVVDHPFLFFIRNRHTGDVLFAGSSEPPLERRPLLHSNNKLIHPHESDFTLV